MRIIPLLAMAAILSSSKPVSSAIVESPLLPFSEIEREFVSPSSTYGTDCWWWWLNGHVTKDAISSELSAMKDKGFYGAMIFDAGGHNQRSNKDIPAGPLFGSPEWCELFSYALDEASRHGLEIGFNIQSGWNLGGPCVTPEYAAKALTYSCVKVDSGGSGITLPVPPSRKSYYRDVAVIAFPLDESSVSPEPISYLQHKLGVHELGGSAPDCRFLLTNDRKDNAQQSHLPYVVHSSSVRNLTGKMSSDGRLDWDIPAGKWVIMRIGYTCTNSAVSTSSAGWSGNVLDYMSEAAFDYYWNTVVQPILDSVPTHVGKTLKYMETDSWECGGMNWTGGFESYFKSVSGYDILPYLPVLDGYVVEDIETSNAFLADFRRAIAQAVSENHYGRFAARAHENGMGIQPESAGPHAGPLDGITNYSHSDIVMSEFWAPSPHRPTPPTRFFVKQASSAAHIYGKRIVGAESFTTIGPHWNDELWSSQKPSFDHEICSGLNRVYLTTFTSSPYEMGLPGQEYFAGTHINPRVTWWSESDGFFGYMSRIQAIAQNGRFIGDVLYYYGDHIPNVYPYKESDFAGAMPGYDYDVTNEEVLLKLKVDKDGRIVTPGGTSYRVLVLPDDGSLSLAAVRQVEHLLRKGATVLGPRPERCVSLKGGDKGRKQFFKAVERIWGTGAKGMKGHLSTVSKAREYLQAAGVPYDFEVEGLGDWKGKVDYIHYDVDGRDVYFISNQTSADLSADFQFRVTCRQPEIWDALDGSMRPATIYSQDDGRTRVPLRIAPYGSMIVVFDEAIPSDRNGDGTPNFPSMEVCTSLTGSWSVTFDRIWGGPGVVTFPELMDWTLSADDGIKYYSGTAVYCKNFMFNLSDVSGSRYYLDLGSVKDVGIARVKLNGKDMGLAWTSPFRFEVTGALKDGLNDLEIEVTNSWYNRVAGDEMNPERYHYTSTNIVLGHDARGVKTPIKLSPSGLIGPVTIRISVPDKMNSCKS